MTKDRRRYSSLLLLLPLFLLCSCGVLTGLPGHGGGKRFAVEQELVAAATRGAIMQIDLSSIRGKRINLFVNAIGDTGSGNLVGGRFSVVSQLRGDYIQSPPTNENSVYPRNTTTTSTTSSTTSSTGSLNSHSTTSSESTSDSLLPSPESKQTQQKGKGGVAQLGVEYKGLGAYQTSEEISSNDLQYLSGILQTYLFLRGVYIVPPSEAEIDVYVIIDVFGTVRSRVEWFLANNEILRAKTSLEVLAVDHLSGSLVMAPQSAGAESEYNEQFILWAGPVMIKQTLRKTKPLLCDFSQFSEIDGTTKGKEADVEIPYPFRHQVDKWGLHH